MLGLLGSAGRMAGKRQADSMMNQPAQMAAMPTKQAQPQQRRGLFGGLGNAMRSVQDFAGRADEYGITNADRISTIGAMMRDDPAIGQNALAMQGRQREIAQERQRETQAQEQERQQRVEMLRGQAEQLGMDPAQFMMLPEATRTELFNRQFAPNEQAAPSAVREYEYAREQGFPGSFQDWRTQNPTGTSVNVNMPGQPQIGSIPAGYEAVRDPQTGNFRMQRIPGGPAEAEQLEQERRQEGRQIQLQRAGGTVIQDVNRALTILDRTEQQGPMSGPAAGPMSGQARVVPGTPAFEMTQLIESALSNVGLDTLQQMRENSPTGGALGQVPIQQQQRLEQVLGSLDVRQRPEVLRDNLNRVSNIYMDIVYGTPDQLVQMLQRGEISQQDFAQYAQRAPLSFDEFGRPVNQSGAGNAPAGGQGGQNAPAGAPRPGDVQDGFEFIGGDPANPSNWRRRQ